MNVLTPKVIELIYYVMESKTRQATVGITLVASIFAIRKIMNRSSVKVEVFDKKVGGTTKNVDKNFMKNLIKLLKICIPKLLGKEMFSLGLLTTSMVFRTILSIYFSEITSQIVKSIVKKDLTEFVINILILFGLSLPGSWLNSNIDYLNKLISIYFRENLTKRFQTDMLKDMCYYKITNLDSRVKNPDQIFTSDIDKFCSSVTTLYNNFSKPFLDIVFFAYKLSKTLGWSGPGIITIWYLLSGVVMKLITPPFGRLSAIEQTLEGEFRANHKKIINHSEEIAFYNGNIWELKKLNETFKLLTRHIKDIHIKKFFMGIFDAMLVKFGATIVGTVILGVPVFIGNISKYNQSNKTLSAAEITEDYIQNSSLLLNYSKAIGKVILSYKDLQNLSGYTFLVTELNQVIKDVNNGKFQRKQINDDLIKKYVGGSILENNYIEFDNVPIITPNGEGLLENISFKVRFNK